MSDSAPFLLIHWLWLGFVLVGFSLFFTAYYFRRQSKRLSKALSDLYELNQSVKQDALDFFDQAWPILESLGCLKMVAKIGWFGEQKEVCLGEQGAVFGKRQNFHIIRDDMEFRLVLTLNRKGAESDSLSFLVIKTFINILEQNLVLKQAEILTSQKRLERYQLFIQHEIKNVAQFIQLLSEQVESLEAEQDKVRLVDRLHQTLPSMAQRAQKTILHMNRSLPKDYECSELKVHILLQEVVEMYGLDAMVTGEGELCLPYLLLVEVFKNILGNFRDHALTEKPIKIKIFNEKPKLIQVTIFSQRDKVHSQVVSERLFEPFWTTSESGMGLGLFLARELLRQMNGQIVFEQDEAQFGFLIWLKIQK